MPTARQLEIFLCVAEAGSMCAAADRLGISQPSISKQIHALEAKLGTSLFERRRGAKIALSERGELLRSHAQKVLQLQRRLVTAGGAHGKLSVLVRQYLFSTIECELSSTKLAKCGMELSFEIVDKHDLIEQVVRRGEDAIALLRSAQIISHPHLTTSVLSVDSCSLYASPSYVALCESGKDPLSKCRVLIPEGGAQRTWVVDQLELLGLPSEHMEETAWYPGAILRRVLEGGVSSILLDAHARDLVIARRLQAFQAPIAPLYLQAVCSKSLDSSIRLETEAKIKGYWRPGHTDD